MIKLFYITGRYVYDDEYAATDESHVCVSACYNLYFSRKKKLLVQFHN